MKVYLIGMPGAGKSTLGRKLATLLNYPFFDLDLEIEKLAGKSISQIFRQHGEVYFRELESNILKTVSFSAGKVVIATGGGTPCFHNNMEFMKEQGLTVYLKATPLILANRLIKTDLVNRPLFQERTKDDLRHFLVETLADRATFYAQAGIVFESRSLDSDAAALAHIIREDQNILS
jgi:shikimate kinase